MRACHVQRAPAPRRAGSGTAAHIHGARHTALRVQLCVVHLTGKPSNVPGPAAARLLALPVPHNSSLNFMKPLSLL